MREVQYDVMTGAPIHVDFGEISLSEVVRVSIPLHLKGEPEGVKTGGGILQQMLRSVEVECLPNEIIDAFNVDVSKLKVGQSIFVRDLTAGRCLHALHRRGRRHRNGRRACWCGRGSR